MKKSEIKKLIREVISEQNNNPPNQIPPQVMDAGVNLYVYKCPEGHEFVNPAGTPGGGNSLFNIVEDNGGPWGHYVVSRGCVPKKVFDPNKEKDPVRGVDRGTSGPYY